MTNQQTNQPPAGWYPDGNGATRWWDGQQWTDRTQEPATTPAPDTSTQSTGAMFGQMAVKAAITLGLLVVWMMQYCVWIPMILGARLFAGALKIAGTMGVAGILLLFLPIIGWIILLMWASSSSNRRQAERHHRQHMEVLAARDGVKPRSMWTPWGIDLLQR